MCKNPFKTFKWRIKNKIKAAHPYPHEQSRPNASLLLTAQDIFAEELDHAEFDLARGPLWRVRLVSTEPGQAGPQTLLQEARAAGAKRWSLVFSFHHAIDDQALSATLQTFPSPSSFSPTWPRPHTLTLALKGHRCPQTPARPQASLHVLVNGLLNSLEASRAGGASAGALPASLEEAVLGRGGGFALGPLQAPRYILAKAAEALANPLVLPRDVPQVLSPLSSRPSSPGRPLKSRPKLEMRLLG